MNMHLKRNEGIQRLTAPRSAALAGILFAVLFATSLVLIRMYLPETLSGDENWIEYRQNAHQVCPGTHAICRD